MLQDQPLDHFPSPPHHFASPSSYEQQQPIDPQIIHHTPTSTHATPRSPPHHHDPVESEEQTFEQYHFQALLNATEDEDGPVQRHGEDTAAVDRDLEMLIEQHDDDDVRSGETRMTGMGDDDEDEVIEERHTPSDGRADYHGTYGASG
jgi:hypothetical protein